MINFRARDSCANNVQLTHQLTFSTGFQTKVVHISRVSLVLVDHDQHASVTLNDKMRHEGHVVPFHRTYIWKNSTTRVILLLAIVE